jgi:hypothetical protein
VNRVKMIQLQNSLLKMGVEAKDALEGGMMEILKHPFSVAKGVKMFETVATSLTRMFDYYCKVKECLTICERSQLIHLIMLVNIVHRRLRKRSVSSEEHVWDWLFTISNDGAEGSWLRQYQAR